MPVPGRARSHAVKAQVVSPTSDAWTSTLAGMRHDIYHLPGYATFSGANEEPGEPVAVIAGDGDAALLFPLILREVPAELTDGPPRLDAVSPKFYPGRIVSGVDEQAADAFAADAIAAAKEALRARGVVSAFVRMHPLFTPPLEAFSRAGRVVDLGDTVSVDLRLSEEELWGQTQAQPSA